GVSFQAQLSPTRVVFGEGVSQHLAKEVQSLGMRRVLLLMDPFVASTAAGEEFRTQLDVVAEHVRLSTDVEPDPTARTIEMIAHTARHAGVDGIVAIGGGSAMDTAKAVGVLCFHQCDTIAPFYFGGGQTPRGMLPLITVPTTAGTGSEVTFVAIVTEPETQRKLLVRHVSIAPDVALVDPLLSATMPKSLTMATGMDALAHALESLTSTVASPLSDALAIQAIPLVRTALPALVRHGHHPVHRAAMSQAATMAGMAFLSGRVHLGHAVGHALGGAFHLPHGSACMVMMPQIMHMIGRDHPQRLQPVAQVFACPVSAVPQAIQQFMQECEAPRLHELLASHAVTHDRLVQLIEGEDRLIGLSPVRPTRADWLQMIEAAW
ncbi:MAG: iron-containing alcohol dehydrogenase, partial [Chloroflexi bacterium]|nr:iron-containing alcohol dehydrogenase [Chloroflexota bacterium]